MFVDEDAARRTQHASSSPSHEPAPRRFIIRKSTCGVRSGCYPWAGESTAPLYRRRPRTKAIRPGERAAPPRRPLSAPLYRGPFTVYVVVRGPKAKQTSDAKFRRDRTARWRTISGGGETSFAEGLCPQSPNPRSGYVSVGSLFTRARPHTILLPPSSFLARSSSLHCHRAASATRWGGFGWAVIAAGNTAARAAHGARGEKAGGGADRVALPTTRPPCECRSRL